jgi:hypothetical protein
VASPVPVDPGADLIDVTLGPGLFPGQVAELGLGHHESVLQLTGPGLQPGQLGGFRHVASAVIEPGEFGVQIGQFEQAELALR